MLAAATVPTPRTHASPQTGLRTPQNPGVRIDIQEIDYAHAIGNQPLIVMDLRDAPIRLVLKKLCESKRVNYEIDPGVTGTVTLKLHYVLFTTALHGVLKASTPRVTYVLGRGVYHFKMLKAV